MSSKPRRMLAALIGVGTLALGAGAAQAAAAPVTVSVPSSVTLLNRLVAPVPLTVTCGPYDPSLTLYSSHGVSLTQAQGRQVAHGSASASSGGFMTPGLPLNCDGAPHNYTLNVYPDQGSPPFHGGKAVIQANALVSFFDPSTFQYHTDTGSAGPQTVSLAG